VETLGLTRFAPRTHTPMRTQTQGKAALSRQDYDGARVLLSEALAIRDDSHKVRSFAVRGGWCGGW